MATGFWPRIYAAGATLAVLALAFLVIVAWSYEGKLGSPAVYGHGGDPVGADRSGPK